MGDRLHLLRRSGAALATVFKSTRYLRRTVTHKLAGGGLLKPMARLHGPFATSESPGGMSRMGCSSGPWSCDVYADR